MSDDREQWLQRRAYAIWEVEGCPEGRDREHWDQAERELSAARAAGQSASSAAEPEVPSTAKKSRRGGAKTVGATAASRRKKTSELRP
jgi:hypothetical protein